MVRQVINLIVKRQYLFNIFVTAIDGDTDNARAIDFLNLNLSLIHRRPHKKKDYVKSCTSIPKTSIFRYTY